MFSIEIFTNGTGYHEFIFENDSDTPCAYFHTTDVEMAVADLVNVIYGNIDPMEFDSIANPAEEYDRRFSGQYPSFTTADFYVDKNGIINPCDYIADDDSLDSLCRDFLNELQNGDEE